MKKLAGAKKLLVSGMFGVLAALPLAGTVRADEYAKPGRDVAEKVGDACSTVNGAYNKLDSVYNNVRWTYYRFKNIKDRF